ERGEHQAVRGVERAFLAGLGPGRREGVVGTLPGGGHLGALGEGEAGAGGDVVAARGEGDLAAPVAAAVDGAVHGDGERLVEPEGEAVLDPDGALLAEGRRLVEGVAGCSVALPGEDQKQGGD